MVLARMYFQSSCGDTDVREHTCGHSWRGGGGGEGEMYGRVTWKHALPHVK